LERFEGKEKRRWRSVHYLRFPKKEERRKGMVTALKIISIACLVINGLILFGTIGYWDRFEWQIFPFAILLISQSILSLLVIKKYRASIKEQKEKKGAS
jgi:hypothetical protein